MPDDVNDTSAEQVEETNEMTAEEQEALFNSIDDNLQVDDEDDKGGDDEDESEDTDDEDADDSGDDEDSDDDSDEDEDDDEDSEESAIDRVKRLAQESKAKTEQTDLESEIEKRVKEREDEIRAEIIKEMTGAEKLTIGDKEIDVNEFREEFGDEIADMIQATVLQALGTTNKAKSEDYVSQSDFTKLQEELAAERHNNALQSRHKDLDISAMQEDEGHAFWKWLDKQDQDVQDLFDGATIPGQSAVLDAFKAETIKTENKAIDKAKGEKHKKHTKLHGSTARTKKTAPKSSKQNSKNMSIEEQTKLFENAEVTD